MARGSNVARLSSLLIAGAAAVLVPAASATAQEETFRFRAGLDAPLNADIGWAGDAGESVTVDADRPFRLRMEFAPLREGGAYALQMRRNEGEWETLEAHDFPHPQRELELEFDAQEPGSQPAGWTVHTGAAGGLTIADDGSGRLLRAAGGGQGLAATYAAPWPLPEFTFAARFRLPADSGDGFAMDFAYVDAANHGRVHFDPESGISIIRVIDGRETLIAAQAAPLGRDVWHEAEIQFEDGEIEINLDDDTLEFSVPLDLTASGDLGIAVSAGEAVDIAGLVVEGVPRTPPVSIVATAAYRNGEETADLLPGSAAPFAPGHGVSLAERVASAPGAGTHGEFEWPLVIRRLADGPDVNEDGDRFEFRMIDSAGQAGTAIARASLAVPAGHLSGTFVENPGRIGPWQAANGDLYFIMEPTETDNKFMMMNRATADAAGVRWMAQIAPRRAIWNQSTASRWAVVSTSSIRSRNRCDITFSAPPIIQPIPIAGSFATKWPRGPKRLH